MWRATYRTARRVVIGVLGLSVILVGIAMMVLPGPAFVVIPAGLAILATEFVWARRLLRRFKDHAVSAAGWLTGTADDDAHDEHVAPAGMRLKRRKVRRGDRPVRHDPPSKRGGRTSVWAMA